MHKERVGTNLAHPGLEYQKSSFGHLRRIFVSHYTIEFTYSYPAQRLHCLESVQEKFRQNFCQI